MRRGARFVAVSTGGLCGLLLPLDVVLPLPGEAAPQLPTERTEVRERAPPCIADAWHRLERDAMDGRAELAAFRRDWGRWVDPPPGWDAEADETRLRAIMDRFPSELSAVSCELYPCVVLMALPGPVPEEVVEEAFGVTGDAVGMAKSVGKREVYTVSVAAIDTSGLDEDQARWTARLRLRLDHQMGPDIDRLLMQAAP